jgi:hypothetical protein
VSDGSSQRTAAVERLLSETYGTGVRVTSWERIEPWFVYRVRLDGEPSSVIVKRLREDPNGFRIDPAQVETEIVALRYVEELGLTFTPRVIAADRATHLIVLEDLHPRVPLPGVLIHGDPDEAADGLLEFARTLGSLNAATAGREHELQPARAISPEEAELVLWRQTLGMVEAFGVSAPSAVTRDVAAILDELDDPGPFLALSNGDAGTNNFLVAPGLDGKLVDFEFARFRHALQDAVFSVPGPQWATVSDAGGNVLEDAYRVALSHGVSAASDDELFGRGLTAASLSYALVRLNRLRKVESRPPGDGSRVQLVSTLESAATVAERFGVLLDLASWLRRTAQTIRRRWPDADVDLDRLPPYTPRDTWYEMLHGA